MELQARSQEVANAQAEKDRLLKKIEVWVVFLKITTPSWKILPLLYILVFTHNHKHNLHDLPGHGEAASCRRHED